MLMAIARNPLSNSKVQVGDVQISETALTCLIREVERLQAQLDLVREQETCSRVEMDGFRARLRGLARTANPHLIDELGQELHDHWRVGWEQANQEVVFQNVVLAGEAVVESAHEDGAGMVWVDGAYLSVLSVAVTEAKTYME